MSNPSELSVSMVDFAVIGKHAQSVLGGLEAPRVKRRIDLRL